MSVLAVYDCMMFFMYGARPERVRETFELVEKRRVTYCLSPEIIAEIEDVLTRPKHQYRFTALTADRVASVMSEITKRCHLVSEVPSAYVLERDPKDSKYINLALAAGAPFLVTRDLDLLDLMERNSAAGNQFRQRFPQLGIMTPRSFVQIVNSTS